MYRIMHRTQLILDDWQYETLKARAEREGQSMSGLVRQVLAEYLVDDQVNGLQRLRELKGLGADRVASGRDHDRFLYGEPSR